MSYGEFLLGKMLSHVFPHDTDIWKNKRPRFLRGLELDFYLPEYNIAFEFQGEQHYIVDGNWVKSYVGLKRRFFYDFYKHELCMNEGVNLVSFGAKYLKVKKFRQYMMSYCDIRKRPDIRNIVNIAFRKNNQLRLSRSGYGRMVDEYIKKLGKSNLTNMSNRHPDLLRSLQEKEIR